MKPRVLKHEDSAVGERIHGLLGLGTNTVSHELHSRFRQQDVELFRDRSE